MEKKNGSKNGLAQGVFTMKLERDGFGDER